MANRERKRKCPVISRFTGPETLSTAMRRGGAASCEASKAMYSKVLAAGNTFVDNSVNLDYRPLKAAVMNNICL